MPSPRRRGEWSAKAEEDPWASDAPAVAEPAPPLREERPPDQPPMAPPPSRSLPPAASLAASPAPAAAGPAGSPDEFLRRVARAAGLPDDVFAQRRPEELADQIGDALRVVAANVMQLLSARGQAKRLTRSASHTMIQAVDNNPLKFSPSSEDALRIMFGPPTRSYLDAHRALEQSFGDLKAHQIKTYSAMQHALTQLMKDLDPEIIEADTDADRGIAALLTSRKAKLWDSFVTRYQAKVRREDGGLIDAFMLYFSEYYDRDGG
jgi:type VI secretion system protein ImpI